MNEKKEQTAIVEAYAERLKGVLTTQVEEIEKLGGCAIFLASIPTGESDKKGYITINASVQTGKVSMARNMIAQEINDDKDFKRIILGSLVLSDIMDEKDKRPNYIFSQRPTE